MVMSAAWITVSLAFCKGLGRAQPSSAEARAPKNNPPTTQDPFGTDREGHSWTEETLLYNTSGDSGGAVPTPFESMTSASRPSSRRQSTAAGKPSPCASANLKVNRSDSRLTELRRNMAQDMSNSILTLMSGDGITPNQIYPRCTASHATHHHDVLVCCVYAIHLPSSEESESLGIIDKG
jgi:hypothetical protein